MKKNNNTKLNKNKNKNKKLKLNFFFEKPYKKKIKPIIQIGIVNILSGKKKFSINEINVSKKIP